MKTSNLTFLLILSLAFGFTISLPAQEKEKQKVNKETTVKTYSFEEAYRLNKKKPRRMVVDVYTEWCGWCKKMDAEAFRDLAIVKYLNSHFYYVRLDAERKDTVVLDGNKLVNPNPTKARSTHQLANELLRGRMSYPSFVFLNEKGQYIVSIPGYHKSREFEAILHFFGEDAYLKEKPENFQKAYDDYIRNYMGGGK